MIFDLFDDSCCASYGEEKHVKFLSLSIKHGDVFFQEKYLNSLILLLGLDPWPLDPLDPPKFFKDFIFC